MFDGAHSLATEFFPSKVLKEVQSFCCFEGQVVMRCCCLHEDSSNGGENEDALKIRLVSVTVVVSLLKQHAELRYGFSLLCYNTSSKKKALMLENRHKIASNVNGTMWKTVNSG